MRNCSRCNSSSPTGLRFCNYCGARLDEAREEDLVFGNLALAPDRDVHYVPPRHLRAVPEGTRVGKVRGIASRARQLAGVAGRVAAEVAADVATKMAERLQSVSRPSPVPVAGLPAPAVAQVAPPPEVVAAAPLRVVPLPGQGGEKDLRAAYELYRRGRTAYDAGDRARAAQLFAAALGRSPPDSPLGQFLARVVKVKRGAPSQPSGRPPPRREVDPVAVAKPVDPVRPTPGPPRAALAAVPSPEHGLVDLSGAGPAVAARREARASRAPGDAGAGVARHRGLPPAERRTRARQAAQRSWLRSLPERCPNRPSQLLDGAGDGAHLERMAGAVMVVSGLGFLGLLLL